MIDIALYVLLFAGSVCIYLPIYRFLVARWSADYVVRSVESGSIDLTYLLDEGGVFDELTDRIVKRFKHNALAELGQMSHQASTTEEIVGAPQMMGIEAAGQLLGMVGMKKPPAILQYKLAQVLGQMVDNVSNQNTGDDFAPPPQFGP